MKRTFTYLIIGFLCALSVFSQDESEILTEEVDSLVENRQGLVGLPVLFYTPETRFGAGLAGIYFFRFKNVSPQTRLSSIQFLGHITQNKQQLLTMPFEFHFNENKHIIKGKWSWFHYPLLYYGIGPYAEAGNEELYTTTSLWVRAYYLYQIQSNFFVGLHYRLDNTTKIEYEEENSLLEQSQILGYQGGASSGLGAVISYDKRDNIYSPSVGPFLEASFSVNRSWTGSDFDFVRLELDMRHYIQLPKRQILAMQFASDFSWGEVPFESLGLLGHYTLNRGYYEGRFRDKALASFQAEWRVPLFWGETPREELAWYQRFSASLFGGLANVAPSPGKLSIDQVKYSYGAGLRVLASRRENVTLRVDYGRGRPGNDGFYFMIGEAF
jgi:hypothetical protein